MNIEIKYINDIAVVEVEGSVNINSSKLIECIGTLLNEGVGKIVIDMQGVDFIDYNGLSVLTIAYKSILNQGGIMKLCELSLHIIELLRIVKLDEIFEIYRDVEDALSSFKGQKKRGNEELFGQPLRRRFKRLDIDIPIHYKLTKTKYEKEDAELFSGRIANISGQGVFIHTMHLLPLGSEVDMDIILKGELKPKSLKGMVMWVADKELQPDIYPGMGVTFTNLSSQQQEDIIEFIEKNIGHLKE